MQLANCFICDDKTIIYCENIYAIRSAHTNTSVMQILRRFAAELDITVTNWPTSRKCASKTIVCQSCMIKINDYDLASMTAKDMERQLKTLLQRKEEIDDNNSDVDYNPDAASSDEEATESGGMEASVMRCNVCLIDFKR